MIIDQSPLSMLDFIDIKMGNEDVNVHKTKSRERKFFIVLSDDEDIDIGETEEVNDFEILDEEV
jgi:hypothetical protein